MKIMLLFSLTQGLLLFLCKLLFLRTWAFIAWLSRRRQRHPTVVLLPGQSHGWRSLEGCSPWGRWGSDMTERLHFHLSLSCIGEGNGNSLQCSCLENPRDGWAWWAAVYGVTQSWTRLKWFSSSSSMTFLFLFSLFLLVSCLTGIILRLVFQRIYDSYLYFETRISENSI